MSRTRILIALLVLVVLVELFPDRSGVIKLVWVLALAGYAATWGVTRLLARRKERAASAAREAADEEEYRHYKAQLDEIRARHDPDRNPDDLTAISQEYKDALNALHDRHQDMLQRKFGPR